MPGFNPKSLTDCREQKQFPCIDVVKLICAVLVITAHIAPFGETDVPLLMTINDIIQRYLCRIAVPFFFVCTGFLLFRRTEPANALSPALGYAKKLLRTYLLWTAIYCVFILRDILMNPQGILQGIVIALRDFFLVGSYVHLWYLHASITAVVLAAFLLSRKVAPTKIFGISLVLYCIGLLAESYFGLIRPLQGVPALWQGLKAVQSVIFTTRNGLFEGLAFVSLGMLLAYKPIRLSLKAAVLGLIASLALLLAEGLLLDNAGWIRDTDYYLSLLPVAFFMFYLAAHIQLKPGKLYPYLRTLSTLVYFIHIWIRGALMILSDILHLGWTQNAMLFLLTLVLSVIGAMVIAKMAQHPKLSFLKKLYA